MATEISLPCLKKPTNEVRSESEYPACYLTAYLTASYLKVRLRVVIHKGPYLKATLCRLQVCVCVCGASLKTYKYAHIHKEAF